MNASAKSELVKIGCGAVHMEGMLEIPADPAGIVLFAHGSGSSRLSPRNNHVAQTLRDAHLATLLIDLLTPQEGQEYQTRFDIALLSHRLLAAANWLQKHSETRALSLGLFGASTGAAAALQLAATPACAVKALVSRGGRPDLAGRVALEKVSAPTLLLVGGLDDVVIGLNQAAFAILQCEKQLVIVPGATHLFEEPGKLEKVAALARDWFVRHLTNAATQAPATTRQERKSS